MVKQAKLREIDLVRAFAMIAVLIVHATSFATLQMKGTALYPGYNFTNVFFKIGTTTFIFLSSFVLFYSYFGKPLTKERFTRFYKNRLMYIIVPYILFSIAYFGIRWYIDGASKDIPLVLTNLFKDLLIGKAYTHLYFVFISIQFYLLFPVLLWLMQRYRWLAASAVLIGIALQWAFFLYNRADWEVPNRASWAITYFGHYFVGAWLGIYFDRIKPWLLITRQNLTFPKVAIWIALWGVCLSAGAFHAYRFHQLRAYGTTYTYFDRDVFWDIHTVLMPLLLIQIAFLLGGLIGRSRWVDALRHLGVVSFGVYLVHPFILLVYRQLRPESGGDLLYLLFYVGGFVAALFISWVAVTWISRKSRLAWVLFGSVPTQLEALDREKAADKQASTVGPNGASKVTM